jgi:hypothetical protein
MHHFRELWAAMEKQGFQGSIRVKDFKLAVANHQNVLELHPQFVAKVNGQKCYVQAPSSKIEAFSGWRENSVRRWDISTEKILFKNYIVHCGLPTPKFCLDSSKQLDNVIIKTSRSSFSRGIRGPYLSSKDAKIDPSKGEFFEQLVMGRIVKIWYWNEKPVAAELLEMLGVFGNGKSSIFELLETHRVMIGESPVNYDALVPFLSLQGISLETIPRSGQEIKVDFKYASIFPMSYRARDIRIGEEEFFGLEDFLKDVGANLWLAIPEEIRYNLVYSVDAILDDKNKLWLLEMNSNPYVHPYVYPHMLQAQE